MLPVSEADHYTTDTFMDMIVKMQGDRMEEQRCALPQLPGLATEGNYPYNLENLDALHVYRYSLVVD